MDVYTTYGPLLLAFRRVDLEFGLEWDSVRNFMNKLYKSESNQEVMFDGELDR